MSDDSTQNFLNRIRIQKDLERFTGGALARQGQIEDLIARIAGLDRPHQDFIYEWSELIGRTNTELAAHFVAPISVKGKQLPLVRDNVNDLRTTYPNPSSIDVRRFSEVGTLLA